MSGVATNTMPEKARFPRAAALPVAAELCRTIKPFCVEVWDTLGGRPISERQTLLKVCGSLRRKKADVGDIEIVYVSRVAQSVKTEPGLFETFEQRESKVIMPAVLDELVHQKVLAKRPKANGQFTWGEQNKLAVHTASGIPIDFFGTTFENFWMTVVIRTGPKHFNLRLIEAARKRGLNLHAYGTFTRMSDGAVVPVNSEREVFEQAGLAWLEPEERR